MQKKFVIVGGGTAGWLSALFVRKVFPESKVTVIQNSKIGIIGVGEATTPNIIYFLQLLDIDFEDVIRETKGSIKSAVNFVNWNGKNERYLHAFEDSILEFSVDNIFQHDCLDYYLKKCIKENLPFEDYYYNQNLCYQNKVDVKNHSFALHFDTNLFSTFLQKKGLERNIEIIDGTVIHPNVNENGFVTSITLEENQTVDCDFVFDCSGLSRLLIGNFYKEKWISFKDHLPMKRGIPFWIDVDKEIEPYTSAIAMKYGWIWKIPLQHRSGCGYIFDSDLIDENQALEEAEEYFGRKLKINKVINFEAGRFENFWIKNVMAVGLASSFIEPLESTSIFLSIAQLLTMRHFLNELDDGYNEKNIKVFNEIVGNNMEETLNFVYMHYYTDRNDSVFWREFKHKHKPPKRFEEVFYKLKDGNFTYFDIIKIKLTALFGVSGYLQVLRGIGVLKDVSNSNLSNVIPSPHEYKKIIQHYNSESAMKLNDYLNGLNRV